MSQLRELYHELIGGDVTKQGLTTLAEKLSTVIGRDEPFTWRYLNSCLKQHKGFERPSKCLQLAVDKLTVMEDGGNPISVEARAQQVVVIGHVAPGSVILGDSKVCAYPPCKVSFVPRSWNGKYCCEEHKKASRKLRRRKK